EFVVLVANELLVEQPYRLEIGPAVGAEGQRIDVTLTATGTETSVADTEGRTHGRRYDGRGLVEVDVLDRSADTGALGVGGELAQGRGHEVRGHLGMTIQADDDLAGGRADA